MYNDFGRPNQRMREQVDDALRQLRDIGRRQAAADLYRQGVPLPVICRVLDPHGERRAIETAARDR